jgi:PBP1b-binding outer membrane lipoprotein LpoB
MSKLVTIIMLAFVLSGCTSRKYEIRRPPVEYTLRHSVKVAR